MAFGKGCCLVMAFLALALQTSNAGPVTGEKWSDIGNACIKGNNYKTFSDITTFEACKAKCVEEGIVCQSVEYNSQKQKCQFSYLRSDSSDYTEPCYVDGWIYAEINHNVDEKWSGIINACIKGNNYKTLADITTFEACKAKCVEEGKDCQSVEYNSQKEKCQFSYLISNSSDYTEPCYVDGWIYSELNHNVDHHTTQTCENKELALECEVGHVINVIQASYGRSENDICPGKGAAEFAGTCHSDTSRQVLDDSCNGQNSCKVAATNAVFSDPCRGTYKYLEVEYVCVPDIVEPNCDWPNGQIYWPHSSDCHMFIQCTPHGPNEMHCAPGTAWSQSLLTCNHAANTEC